MLELREEDWDRVIRTNLKGCFLNTQRAAQLMVQHGKRGSIINIGSGCNKVPFPRLVDYTASKGGIEQFTKVSALELGPHGIRVNCVAPGAIELERTKAESPDYAKNWASVAPLKRVGRARTRWRRRFLFSREIRRISSRARRSMWTGAHFRCPDGRTTFKATAMTPLGAVLACDPYGICAALECAGTRLRDHRN